MELKNYFTTFKPAEVPKVEIQTLKGLEDISSWADFITDDGAIIVKSNLPEIPKQETILETENSERKVEVPKQEVTNVEAKIPEVEVKGSLKLYSNNNRMSDASLKKGVEIMNGLINRGIDSAQAAAMAGHAYAESGYNPKTYTWDVNAYGGGLFGFLGKNYEKLKEYAKSTGRDLKNIDTLLDFMVDKYLPDASKMTYGNKTNAQILAQALSLPRDNYENTMKALEQITRAFSFYERHAGYDGTTNTAKAAGWSLNKIDNEINRRIDFTKQIFNAYYNFKNK